MRIFLMGLFLLLAACGGKPGPGADSFVVDVPNIHIEGKLKPGAKAAAEQAKMMIQYAVSGAK